MVKHKKKKSFKIQNNYRQIIRRIRRDKDSDKFEVIIIALIFLSIIILKWLD